MANSIQIMEKYSTRIDEKNKSLFAFQSLVNESLQTVKGMGTVFKVPKHSITGGIGTYDKDGTEKYPVSAVNVDYELVPCDYDLGAKIEVDEFDDSDTDGIAFAGATNDVVDALIAQRNAMTAASICNGATHKVEEALTSGDDVVESLRKAIVYMKNKNVRSSKLELYATPDVIGALEDMDSYKSKQILNSFAVVKEVPQDEFLTKIDINTGRGDGAKFGYTKAADGRNINFMIVDRDAVVSRYFDIVDVLLRSENRTLDANTLKLRSKGLSAYVFDNKKDNIAVSYGVE